MSNKFDKDYYEHGVEKRISGYQDYHWMPTRSYPEAVEIRNRFPNHPSVLEIGCAKGFLVHALRQLGVIAWGEDISDYALENAYPPVKKYLSKPNGCPFSPQLIICKDILEHVPEFEMNEFLGQVYRRLNENFRGMFLAIIPLGDNDLFRIREYEIDVTHVTKKDEDWWINKFKENGFKLCDFSYSMGAIKEKWVREFPYGNGFFVLEK
jgi:SAM-dependent methyltransferase